MSAWEHVLDGLDRIVVDTNVVIYFVDNTAPYGPLTKTLFRRCEIGALSVVVPTLVELELLVGPLRDEDPDAVDRLRILLDHFPNLEVVPMDRSVVRLAAEARVEFDLPTPDAIVVGTAMAQEADGIISNDKRWGARIDHPRCVMLADHV